MARHADERHYGLGDKAGPLDRTGRRFAIDAVDPCGFDAELVRSALQDAAVLHRRWARAARTASSTTISRLGSVDLGCTIDNYHGLFRSYRADDGDLDYYVLAGPTVPEVTRRFSWLTGGQAFAPRWSLGFAMTSMTIADAPDADARITDFIEDCRRHGIRCDSFHFGSGYTSIGTRRYVFNWNRDKFPDPAATMARLKAAGMQPVTNIKPCLLDDHPRLDEARADGILVEDGDDRRAGGRAILGRPRLPCRLHQPGRPATGGRDGHRDGAARSTASRRSGTTTTNSRSGTRTRSATATAGRIRQALARPAQPLLMHKLAYETQAAHAPGKRPYVITRGGGAGHRPLRPDLVAATTRPPGRRCAST